jgi:hypothetical protein
VAAPRHDPHGCGIGTEVRLWELAAMPKPGMRAAEDAATATTTATTSSGHDPHGGDMNYDPGEFDDEAQRTAVILHRTVLAAGWSFLACVAAYVAAIVLLATGRGLAGLLVSLVATFLVGFASRLTDHAARLVSDRMEDT